MKTGTRFFRNYALASRYRRIEPGPGRLVREYDTGPPAFAYSERHLQCLWYDPGHRPPSLPTSNGELVRVEQPGRWNLEAGPDFLDAVLTVGPGKRKLAGDVEVHVRPADWLNHGHAADPAYARVVAHVTYFPGTLPADALPPGAVRIALREALTGDPALVFEAIDVTAYPYAAPLPGDPPPCARALAARSPDFHAVLLEAAGSERLRIKTARMAAAIRERGPEQVLYEEILAALGYKRNRTPFRRLALRLPLETLRARCGADPVRAYALLLGTAGLLPTRTSPHWDRTSRRFVRRLWQTWWKQQSEWEHVALQPHAWRLAGLRPQNHPVRRLAAAAAIFHAGPDPATRWARIDTADPAAWFREAARVLAETRGMAYWRRRLTFSGAPHGGDIALIGARRAAAILGNVAVPFLAARGRSVDSLLPHLPPEQDNALVRQAAFSLFGRDHNPALYRSGLRRQGLLQIFHDFCLNDRSGCRACPLPAALADQPVIGDR